MAAAFAVAMAIVLTAAGALIYVRVGDDLSSALYQDLRLRAQDLTALVRDPGNLLRAEANSHLVESGESFAEVLDGHGRVIDASRSLDNIPLLSPAQTAFALRRDRFIDRPSAPGLDEPARLLAVPVNRGSRRVVLVVGATRENRAETLRSLRTQLLIAGPVALVLATLIGYFLAGAGLRSVETMRRRAAQISADKADGRLPVPRTRDELQRLGETLNEMLGRLEHGLARERRFVAEAGHELRTPLALLRAELDYALHYADGEDELRGALKLASQETDRLVQLASDLLLFASSDQGGLRLRSERLSARELMESVCARFAWRAEAEGRLLKLDAQEDVVLHGDRLRLEQALGNLLDNALRHGAGVVTLTTAASNGTVELHVRDQGNGFPDELLGRAFERFSRTRTARSGGGAGLGLSIVETIAVAHHGRAAANNPPNGGADVAIHLPPG
ncbi:MAG: HAMP domain-containing protein [Solirubrobacterales bacterium]|nr:HAMP domain-containing protein [Solirubrobacterales bacterium]